MRLRRREAALLLGGRGIPTRYEPQYEHEIRPLIDGLQAAVRDAEVVVDTQRTEDELSNCGSRPDSRWDQDELARREEAKKRREEEEERRHQEWLRRREDFLREHPEAIELEAAEPTLEYLNVGTFRRDWEWRVEDYLREHPEAKGLVVPWFPPPPPARLIPDADVLVQLVLPTAVGAIVTAVVDTAVGWLRRLHQPGEEHAVLIYGPNGEPLRKIRLRRGLPEPEIFEHKWPLPPE